VKKYTLKSSQSNTFLYWIATFFLLLLISYIAYDEFAFLDIITLMIPVFVYQLFSQKTISIEDDNIIVKEFSLFGGTSSTSPISSISSYQKFSSGYTIRIGDRTIILGYYMHKKSDVCELISLIKKINPEIRECKKIFSDDC